VANEFYFVLGDRTSLSLDSRHWGLIPRAWVIGSPIAVYWSAEPGSPEGGFARRLRGVRWSRIGHLVR
jgi:signal peptidase I